MNTHWRELKEDWDGNRGRDKREGRRRRKKRWRGDVVHAAQLSLAQVSIRPPALRSAALRSCSSGCTEGGWTYRSDGMDEWGKQGGVVFEGKGRTDGDREEKGWEGGRGGGGVCLVISSRSLPSGAVVRWLAGHPGGPRACAGPPTRRRSGPGCHLGCSGRSSSQLPGRRPPRFHL